MRLLKQLGKPMRDVVDLEMQEQRAPPNLPNLQISQHFVPPHTMPTLTLARLLLYSTLCSCAGCIQHRGVAGEGRGSRRAAGGGGDLGQR